MEDQLYVYSEQNIKTNTSPLKAEVITLLHKQHYYEYESFNTKYMPNTEPKPQTFKWFNYYHSSGMCFSYRTYLHIAAQRLRKGHITLSEGISC